MKQCRINIKPTAENDMARRFAQIECESPQNAVSWYLGLIDAIEKLDVLAERCPIAPEAADTQKGVRHRFSTVIIRSCRIIYRDNK